MVQNNNVVKNFIDRPIVEITLRRYEKPYNLDGRELIRKICLSLGILQPGDSRDIIIDILSILLEKAKEKVWLSSEEIRELIITRHSKNLDNLKGIAPSNIRRQLKRLRDMQLIEKMKNKYRIVEFMTLSEWFNERLIFLLDSIKNRVSDYIKLYDNTN